MGSDDETPGGEVAGHDGEVRRPRVSERVLRFRDEPKHATGRVVLLGVVVTTVLWVAQILPLPIPRIGTLGAGVLWVVGVWRLVDAAVRRQALSLFGVVAIIAGDVIASDAGWSAIGLAIVVVAALWIDHVEQRPDPGPPMVERAPDRETRT